MRRAVFVWVPSSHSAAPPPSSEAACAHVCVCVYACMHMCARVCVRARVCAHVYECACICVRTCACMHVYVCVCVYVQTCMCVFVYVVTMARNSSSVRIAGRSSTSAGCGTNHVPRPPSTAQGTVTTPAEVAFSRLGSKAKPVVPVAAPGGVTSITTWDVACNEP